MLINSIDSARERKSGGKVSTFSSYHQIICAFFLGIAVDKAIIRPGRSAPEGYLQFICQSSADFEGACTDVGEVAVVGVTHEVTATNV